MIDNLYVKDMINRVIKNPPRLLLPEFEDSRIQEAKKKLLELGFNILDINEFDNIEKYKQHIKNKKFTNNWTDQMLEDYIHIPLIKSLVALDMGHADCLVAGADTSTADVIKSSIRIIGLNNRLENIFLFGC